MAGDLKAKYGSSAAYTISLNSLTSSPTAVAGWESTEVDNTTNVHLDYIIAGKMKAGTSPTAGNFVICAWGSLDDTPTRPSLGSTTNLSGTDAAATFLTAAARDAATTLLAAPTVDATTGRTMILRSTSLCARMGGLAAPPKRHGLWVSHNTVANLDSGAGGSFAYTPVLAQYT